MKPLKSLLILIAAVLSYSIAPVNAEPLKYVIDQDHSQVIFKVKHMGISTVTGRFDKFEGTYTFDAAAPANSEVEVNIYAASINSNKAKRDKHLRSDEFLDVEKNPDITFVSKEIKNGSSDNEFTIIGDLTINGITRTVELEASYGGAATDPWGNERSAFTAETKINREDYGLTWNKTLDLGNLLVGNDVKIILEIEGIRTK